MPPPVWGEVIMATASVLILGGLFLGSRGVGKPLTTRLFFSLLFAFPCWIPAVVYLVGFATAALLGS